MTIYQGYDASRPPRQPYPGARWAGGYIGGATPHVWTLDEWNHAITRPDGSHLRSLPFWVLERGTDAPSPASQARAAAAAAVALGWRAHSRPLRQIAIDRETWEVSHLVRAFAAELLTLGFVGLDYGSAGTLHADPSGLPEFVAHYDVPPGPFTDKQVAFQYRAGVPYLGTTVDLDVCGGPCWDHMGRGPRHAVTPALAAAATEGN